MSSLATATFASRSLSFAPRPSIRTPSKTLKPLTLGLLVHQSPGRRPTPASRSQFRFGIDQRSLNAHLKASQSDHKIINGDEESQMEESTWEKDANAKDLPSVKILIQTYKKALLDGDEKSACEMEAAILQLENEKNALSLKFEEMTEEITSGKDRLLRLKADFENFRKSSEKDRLTFTSNMQMEVVESLLPMVDSFERAKQQIKPETEKEKKIDVSYQGIYKQFVEIMRNLRVAVVETVGKPFDPSIHEAVAREESEQFKEGIVIQELRRGFVLGDRLLRPATVKVSTGPGPGKAAPATEKSIEQPEGAEAVEKNSTQTINN